MSVFSFKNSQGRRLRYFDNGNTSGTPILFFHGFPGGYEQGLLINSTKKNIRFISFDRPGLGESDLQGESSLLGFAKDLEELIDHLGLNQVCLMGISGGAPYTVATAFHLQTRVQKISLICPLSPLSFDEVFKAMPESSQKLFLIYKNSPLLSKLVLKTYRQLFLFHPEFFFSQMIKRYPEEDRTVLAPGSEVRTHLLKSFQTGFQQGIHGLNSDLKNYFSPLTYDLNHILTPVDIWHGTKDNVVPYQVGKWYARNLPHGNFHLIENEGHFSLPCRWHEQILDALLESPQNKEVTKNI